MENWCWLLKMVERWKSDVQGKSSELCYAISTIKPLLYLIDLVTTFNFILPFEQARTTTGN